MIIFGKKQNKTPSSGLSFFDDFIGGNYRNRIWSVSGTGSATHLSQLNGVIRVRATSGNSYELFVGDEGLFSVAKNFVCKFNARFNASSSGQVECGMEASDGNKGNNWIAWQTRPSVSNNYLCENASGGNVTQVDSGVAYDSNYHDFEIRGYSGHLEYWLDGILKSDITTNITAFNLQPYAFNVGSGGASDCYLDYIHVTGDR